MFFFSKKQGVSLGFLNLFLDSEILEHAEFAEKVSCADCYLEKK